MESGTPSRDTAWAMSEENVDVVRRAFDAVNRRDMDALRELHDPDVIMRAVEGWPEPGPFVGREAAMRWYAELLGAFDIDAMEQISCTDAGDRVVLQCIWHGMGRGPEMNLEFTGVFTVRKGRVALVEFFLDHDDALEAAGLRE
jgi:ketosteroid isomerase-like protein